MRKIITYGTFDLFHDGHLNILKRARGLGDYLVVGVTSETYDVARGKLNVSQSLAERIENVKMTGMADEIIVEEREGQKEHDIKKHGIKAFAIGSDWLGRFDHLKEYCEVVYLPRTPGVSSSALRAKKHSVIRIGMAGYGRIARRFVGEAKYVSGTSVEKIFGRNEENMRKFVREFELDGFHTDYDRFLDSVDAVYIATPHLTHYDLARRALLGGRHVLLEKPMCLIRNQARELFDIAYANKLILSEAIKTAYAPGFVKLVETAKSGEIGEIKNVCATFTKLMPDKTARELDKELGGGSVNELGSYPLTAIAKLLGHDFNTVDFTALSEGDIDTFSRINFVYPNAMATATAGMGCKQEGDCVIAGTKGYIYVPAPWWKTEKFFVKFEDPSQTREVFVKYEADGLRYEIADFANAINTKKRTGKLTADDSVFIAGIIERFNAAFNGKNMAIIK